MNRLEQQLQFILEIDKVKKKLVPILTLRKEYGIVIKHRINFHSSA